MSGAPVCVLAGVQTDFARALAREGVGFVELIREALEGALAAARIEASEVGAVHVGNFVGELTTGQGHLGGLVAEAVPALCGVRTARHEAACASGSAAIVAASAEIAAGYCDVALVLGVELLRTLPGAEAQRRLAAAAWVPRETEGVEFVWPALFAALGDEYEARYGLDRRHLVALARQAFANARRNPNAQTRGWSIDAESFGEDEARNPRYAGRIRKHDCSQLTDGAACVVLASEAFARAWAERRGDRYARIAGWSMRTAAMPMRAKLAASRGASHVFPEARRCVAEALARAGVADVWGLDTVEVHDCFTTTAYMAIDHLGITAPGENWRAIEDGTLAFGGRLPLNPGGGLIGCGHPVGATGVRMLLDVSKQVCGRAGEYQVAGARRAGFLNIGGSVTTTACFVVEGRL